MSSLSKVIKVDFENPDKEKRYTFEDVPERNIDIPYFNKVNTSGIIYKDNNILNSHEELHNQVLSFDFSKEIDTAFQKTSEVMKVEIDIKEYLDSKISAVEQKLEGKIDSNQTLIVEKLDHLHTKIEASLEQKITNLEKAQAQEKKESRKFILTTVIASVGVAVAIIGVLIAWLQFK